MHVPADNQPLVSIIMIINFSGDEERIELMRSLLDPFFPMALHLPFFQGCTLPALPLVFSNGRPGLFYFHVLTPHSKDAFNANLKAFFANYIKRERAVYLFIPSVYRLSSDMYKTALQLAEHMTRTASKLMRECFFPILQHESPAAKAQLQVSVGLIAQLIFKAAETQINDTLPQLLMKYDSLLAGGLTEIVQPLFQTAQTIALTLLEIGLAEQAMRLFLPVLHCIQKANIDTSKQQILQTGQGKLLMLFYKCYYLTTKLAIRLSDQQFYDEGLSLFIKSVTQQPHLPEKQLLDRLFQTLTLLDKQKLSFVETTGFQAAKVRLAQVKLSCLWRFAQVHFKADSRLRLCENLNSQVQRVLRGQRLPAPVEPNNALWPLSNFKQIYFQQAIFYLNQLEANPGRKYFALHIHLSKLQFNFRLGRVPFKMEESLWDQVASFPELKLLYEVYRQQRSPQLLAKLLISPLLNESTKDLARSLLELKAPLHLPNFYAGLLLNIHFSRAALSGSYHIAFQYKFFFGRNKQFSKAKLSFRDKERQKVQFQVRGSEPVWIPQKAQLNLIQFIVELESGLSFPLALDVQVQQRLFQFNFAKVQAQMKRLYYGIGNPVKFQVQSDMDFDRAAIEWCEWPGIELSERRIEKCIQGRQGQIEFSKVVLKDDDAFLFSSSARLLLQLFEKDALVFGIQFEYRFVKDKGLRVVQSGFEGAASIVNEGEEQVEVDGVMLGRGQELTFLL